MKEMGNILRNARNKKDLEKENKNDNNLKLSA